MYVSADGLANERHIKIQKSERSAIYVDWVVSVWFFVRIQLYVTLLSLAVFIIPTIIIGVCYAIIVSVVRRKAALLTPEPRVRWSSTGSSLRPLSRVSSQARRYPARSGVCTDWRQGRLWKHRGIAAVNCSECRGYATKMLGLNHKSKFHLLQHVTTRHVSRIPRVRRSSSARVYKFILLCSGFASISGIICEKSEVDNGHVRLSPCTVRRTTFVSLHFGTAKNTKPFNGFHSNRNVGKHWPAALLQGRKVSSGRKWVNELVEFNARADTTQVISEAEAAGNKTTWDFLRFDLWTRSSMPRATVFFLYSAFCLQTR